MYAESGSDIHARERKQQLEFKLWHLSAFKLKKTEILSKWRINAEVPDLTFQSTLTLYNAVFTTMHLQSL